MKSIGFFFKSCQFYKQSEMRLFLFFVFFYRSHFTKMKYSNSTIAFGTIACNPANREI